MDGAFTRITPECYNRVFQTEHMRVLVGAGRKVSKSYEKDLSCQNNEYCAIGLNTRFSSAMHSSPQCRYCMEKRIDGSRCDIGKTRDESSRVCNGYCDSNGKCSPCTEDSDCAAGHRCYVGGLCLIPDRYPQEIEPARPRPPWRTFLSRWISA